MAAVTSGSKIPPMPPPSTSTSVTGNLSPDALATAEKIRTAIFIGEIILILAGIAAVVGMGCLVAIVFFEASLFLPAVASLVASAVLGPIGQMIIDNAEAEARTQGITDIRHVLARVFEPGQPVGFVNEGNSCFIDATFQMIMNDGEMCKALRETFTQEIARHEVFLTFIDWLNAPSDAPALTADVLGGAVRTMITRHSPELLPNFDADQIKRDATLKQSIESHKLAVQKKLSGFKAFIAAEAQYREAERDQRFVVKEGGWFNPVNLLSGLRNVMVNGSPWGQHDAAEFLRDLLNWVEPAVYPNLFFVQDTEQLWKPYHTDDIDRMAAIDLEFRERQERSRLTTDANQQLTQLPGNSVTMERKGIDCIITIQRLLVEGASAQTLLDETLAMQNPSVRSDYKCYARGVFEVDQERTVIQGVPDRFVLELKRFEAVSHGVTRKIDATVHVPEVLTMQGQNYRLKSIVHHSGGVGWGHYTSYVRKGDMWWFIDDMANGSSAVRATNLQEGLNKGYLYFYERV